MIFKRKSKKEIDLKINEYIKDLKKANLVIDLEHSKNFELNLYQVLDSKIEEENILKINDLSKSKKYYLYFREEIERFEIEIDEITKINVDKIKKDEFDKIEDLKKELILKYPKKEKYINNINLFE